MPAMTAREFADTIAVPTVEDFMRDPTQRRGYLACLAAYHLGDYLKPAGPTARPKAVHQAMEDELGAPFLALQRMANAVKHREKVEARVILMEAGSDLARPATGLGIGGDIGGDMNPGDGQPGNVLRLGDLGGRYIPDGGRFYDMLDVCLIVLRAYAKLYPAELSGSLIDRIRYNTADYPRA